MWVCDGKDVRGRGVGASPGGVPVRGHSPSRRVCAMVVVVGGLLSWRLLRRANARRRPPERRNMMLTPRKVIMSLFISVTMVGVGAVVSINNGCLAMQAERQPLAGTI